MYVIHKKRDANGYRQILGAAFVCVLALLALHHLAPYSDSDTHSGNTCPLCVLLSTALLAPFAVVALVAIARRSFVPPRPSIPTLRTDTWTAWSHRGPPPLDS